MLGSRGHFPKCPTLNLLRNNSWHRITRNKDGVCVAGKKHSSVPVTSVPHVALRVRRHASSTDMLAAQRRFELNANMLMKPRLIF